MSMLSSALDSVSSSHFPTATPSLILPASERIDLASSAKRGRAASASRDAAAARSMVSRCVSGRVGSEVDEGSVEPVRASVWPNAGAELAVAMVDTTDMSLRSLMGVARAVFVVEDVGCRTQPTWKLGTMYETKS